MLHGIAQKQKRSGSGLAPLCFLRSSLSASLLPDWCAARTSIPTALPRCSAETWPRSVVATGKIQPITKVEVKSKASGIVEKLYADINNKVHKGQPLAQLDQQEILAQVEAQRAQLAAAEANVATYEANIEQDKVNAAAPDLPMYKAKLERNQQMAKEGIVSRQALDDANRTTSPHSPSAIPPKRRSASTPPS